VSIANITPLMCTSTKCTIVVRDGSDNHLVFYDADHINRYFAVWVVPAVESLLSGILPH
jgi:ribulose kinase